jgi:hypothetical protein
MADQGPCQGRVWTIFGDRHHCHAFLMFFWLEEATVAGGKHQSKIA